MWFEASAFMVVMGVATVVALQFIDAPYGKFAPEKASKFGPLLPARWGWIIQESPSLICVLICWIVFSDKSHSSQLPNQILASMFCFHYVVRAWIFPFLLNDAKPTPLVVVLSAFVFCTYNGILQGSYLFLSPETRHYEKDWLSLWRVRFGIALFFFGWCMNQHADYVLRHLRDKKVVDPKVKKQEEGKGEKNARYHIPQGGLFEFTSAANYTGEIIEWTGFTIAAWSTPALAFLLFTLANLVPRGVSYHRWYLKQFPNYPKERKAVIPFLL